MILANGVAVAAQENKLVFGVPGERHRLTVKLKLFILVLGLANGLRYRLVGGVGDSARACHGAGLVRLLHVCLHDCIVAFGVKYRLVIMHCRWMRIRVHLIVTDVFGQIHRLFRRGIFVINLSMGLSSTYEPNKDVYETTKPSRLYITTTEYDRHKLKHETPRKYSQLMNTTTAYSNGEITYTTTESPAPISKRGFFLL